MPQRITGMIEDQCPFFAGCRAQCTTNHLQIEGEGFGRAQQDDRTQHRDVDALAEQPTIGQ
jgi:hypothetical protein